MRECHTICWSAVRKKIQTEDWAAALQRALEKGFEEHLKNWPGEPPTEESAWAHYYFCSACGTKLTFHFQQPHAHTCPACGRLYQGDPYDGAWRKYLHGSIVTNLERAAVLLNLTDEDARYREYLRAVIGFYSEHYLSYKVHGRHAGLGRVFPQMLSEAIFVIAIERILRMSSEKEVFSAAELQQIGEKFFRPAQELLLPQLKNIHNISAWLVGAVSACASFLGETELLQKMIYGGCGWRDQLQKGVTGDGLWYEISSTYHFYTIEALLSTAWIALENGIDLFKEERFRLMATVPSRLIGPDGRLPAYNDGWPNNYLHHYAHLFEQFAPTDSIGALGPILSYCYMKQAPDSCSPLHALPNPEPTPPTGFARCSLAALLYGRPLAADRPIPQPGSLLLPQTGIAILQNKACRVAMKFTSNGGFHDHNDKLALELYADGEALSLDPGTTGYSVGLTENWSRTTLAHNTLCVNTAPQAQCAAEALDFDGQSAAARTTQAYPGVTLTRAVRLLEDGFQDCFTAECSEISELDYMFRCLGALSCSLPMQKAQPLKNGNGYDQLQDLWEAAFEGEAVFEWRTGRQRLLAICEGAAGTRYLTGKCFGRDATEQFSFLMIRRRSKNTAFRIRYQLQPLP